MMFAGSIGVGFMAVLSFVAVFALIASAVWSNSRKDERKEMSWEQREPSAQDQLRIILIIAAVLLVCIILTAFGLK